MLFFKALESAVPVKPGEHHGISYCKYGNDTDGWSDRLGLHVRIKDGFQTFFLDDDDFDKPIDALVAEITDALRASL